MWYGGTGTSIADPTNAWSVKLSQLAASGSALDSVVATVSNHPIHSGEICTTGVTCSGNSRALLDFFQVAMSPDGRAAIAWADDSASPGAAQVYVAEQCAGTSATTGKALASTC